MRTGGRLDQHAVLLVLAVSAFVVGVYVVVVVGGGVLLGRTGGPSTALSVVATALVALGIEPVQRRLEAARLPGGGGSPYHVLRRSSGAASAGDDVPEQMARLLAEGLGARWVQVWLTTQDRLVLTATWPLDAAADPAPPPGSCVASAGCREVTVRHGGQVYGVLRLQQASPLPLTSVEERLLSGLAAQAGAGLRLLSLRRDSAARRDDLLARAEELRASRVRLIEAQDAEQRRLERDLHDGAQQHLVALAVNLRLAQTLAERAPSRAAGVLVDQAAAARAAVQTLSELSRGLYPARLAEEGLAAALREALRRNPVPVAVHEHGGARLPPVLETVLWFVVMEAVQNATKHASPRALVVHLATEDGAHVVSVCDDGAGFDVATARRPGGGTGLANMADRLDVVGGVLAVESAPGAGTTVRASVPVAAV